MVTLLRPPAVAMAIGMSLASVYVRVNQGMLTKPVKLGARAAAWPADEIEAINRARLAGKTNDEIRALVNELHAKRKA